MGSDTQPARSGSLVIDSGNFGNNKLFCDWKCANVDFGRTELCPDLAKGRDTVVMTAGHDVRSWRPVYVDLKRAYSHLTDCRLFSCWSLFTLRTLRMRGSGKNSNERKRGEEPGICGSNLTTLPCTYIKVSQLCLPALRNHRWNIGLGESCRNYDRREMYDIC